MKISGMMRNGLWHSVWENNLQGFAGLLGRCGLSLLQTSPGYSLGDFTVGWYFEYSSGTKGGWAVNCSGSRQLVPKVGGRWALWETLTGKMSSGIGAEHARNHPACATVEDLVCKTVGKSVR